MITIKQREREIQLAKVKLRNLHSEINLKSETVKTLCTLLDP